MRKMELTERATEGRLLLQPPAGREGRGGGNWERLDADGG